MRFFLPYIVISFTHRADRELNGLSRKTTLIIQAIKALGTENITKEIKLIPSNIHKEALRRDYTKMASMIYGERPILMT